jgi:hypothetical protein
MRIICIWMLGLLVCATAVLMRSSVCSRFALCVVLPEKLLSELETAGLFVIRRVVHWPAPVATGWAAPGP